MQDKDSLVLRSLMQFMSDNLGMRLRFENSERSDLLFIDLESAAGAERWHRLQGAGLFCIACATLPPEGLDPARWLAKPFRGRAVRDLLEALQHPASTPVPTLHTLIPARGAEPLDAPSPRGAEDGFAQLQAMQGKSRLSLEGPRLPLLFLDFVSGMAHLPTVEPGEFDAMVDHWTLEGTRTSAGEMPLHYLDHGTRVPLERLLWHFSTYHSRGRLLADLPVQGAYGLNRWPDFGSLPFSPEQRRMAAMMVAAPCSIERLMERCRLGREEVVASINAARLCHWLEVAPVQSALRSAASGGLLRETLSLIRSRLGLAS